jgi:4-diphosphocytidyl-2C-methyl-D-erythritol kinase
MTSRPRRVVVRARAKLNLGLAVGPRRPDGDHELVTFFQSVSLADTLIATPRRRGFTLRVRSEQAAIRGGPVVLEAPRGAGNLVIEAARAFAAETGLSAGAAFELVKRIPSEAGLGGGSADAAAAIVALARLHRVTLAPAARRALAARLGADVPFALRGGTALGLGRGERLSPLELDRPFRALIAIPRWSVSTAAAYRRIDRAKYGLTAWDTKLRFAQSIGRKRLRMRDALRFGNTFEGVLGSRRGDFEFLCARLRVAGIENPRLTGSGSAVFGVLGPRASIERMVERFEGREALFVVESTRKGVAIEAQS